MVDDRSRTMAVDPAAAEDAVASMPFARGARAAALAALAPVVLALPEGAEPVSLSAAIVPFRLGEAWHLAVVAKLAFAVQRGADGARLVAASTAEPIRARDAHHRNQPLGRVTAPSDRAPYKPRVDVTVVGHAHAPAGRPVTAMDVRLALSQHGATPIDKVLRVIGPRDRDDAEPRPFTSMPIGYDRAFGGVETPANPIGVGEDDEDDERPNVLDPREPRRPAGFGPLAAAWPARARQLGGVPRRVVEAAVPELPVSFAWSYYQHAPADQRLALLALDAKLELDGFDPDFPALTFALPEAQVVGALYGLDPEGHDRGTPLVFHADGLHLDTDRWICELVARASTALPPDVDVERLVIAVGAGLRGELPALPARRPQIAAEDEHAAPERRGSRRAATVLWEEAAKVGTLAMPSQRAEPPGPVLPFGAAPGAVAAAAAATSSAVAPHGGSLAGDDMPVPSSPWARAALPPTWGASRPSPTASPSVASRVASPTSWSLPRGAGATPTAPAIPAPEPISLEVHAAIAAELEEPRALRAHVLARRGLSAAEHASAAHAWKDALRRELRAGGHALRDRYDDAWVGAWEALHPDLFGVDDYARLDAAERRGVLLAEVDDMGLDAGVALRLRRVWRRRVANDVRLRSVLEAVRASHG